MQLCLSCENLSLEVLKKDLVAHLNCHQELTEWSTIVHEVAHKTAQEVLSQSETNFLLCTVHGMLEKVHILRLRHICDDQDSKNAIFWHGNFGLRNILF